MALSQRKIGVTSGVSVGIVLCRTTGRVVFVENTAHRSPMKKIPGGTIEYGETAEGALLREIREETLLNIDEGDVNFLFEHAHPVHEHAYWVFVCTIENFNGMSKEPIPDGNEILVARAYTLDQTMDMVNGGTQNGKLVPIHKEMLGMGLQIIYAELQQ